MHWTEFATAFAPPAVRGLNCEAQRLGVRQGMLVALLGPDSGRRAEATGRVTPGFLLGERTAEQRTGGR